MKILLPVLLAAITLARADQDDAFLAEVQRRIPNNSWKAKKINLEHELKTRRLGWLKKETKSPLRPGINLREIENNYDPPKHFDSRKQWENCTSISKIWDQAACGSCWAFSAATSMSDRLCIHKQIDFLVSPEDVLSCCKTGIFLFEEQCGTCDEGGYIESALDYFVFDGVCSGGAFGEKDTCKPYSIDPRLTELQPTPECTDSCTDKSYGVSYEDDLQKGSNNDGHYKIPANQKLIMEEIEKNGPVAAGFLVYEDFMSYDSGIYQHGYGEQLGGHAVRIIGWGTEDDIDYWLIANSWSESWGEGGTFRFLRGSNECDIENNVYAALP